MEDSIICNHNQRCRYTHGFYCEDCDTFFSKESEAYRQDELLGNLYLGLHNINADSHISGHGDIKEIVDMMDKIGIGIKRENYEELISETEAIMKKYRKGVDSYMLVLGE